MKPTRKVVAAAAAALALAVAGGVYAQGGPGWMYGGGPGWMHGGPGMYGGGPGWMHGGPGMYGGGPGWMHGGMGPWGFGGYDQAAVAERLADFKARLKITPAQDGAWKAYESAVQQQGTTMQTMHDQMPSFWQTEPGSAEFKTQRDAMIKLHDTAWDGYNTAVKNLYGALTPEQRAIADRGGLGFGRPYARRGRPVQ